MKRELAFFVVVRIFGDNLAKLALAFRRRLGLAGQFLDRLVEGASIEEHHQGHYVAGGMLTFCLFTAATLENFLLMVAGYYEAIFAAAFRARAYVSILVPREFEIMATDSIIRDINRFRLSYP